MATLTFTITFPIFNIVSHASIEVIIASTIVSLVILFKHAVNFKRILQKEEIGINGKKTGINLLKKEEA